ncbi:MAG: hypothetical protein PVI27_09760, partial [Desulfobacteraceae bacterium]
RTVRELAEKAGDSELIGGIRNLEKNLEVTQKLYQNLEDVFRGEDDDDEAFAPPERKRPPRPRQLELF